MWRSGWSASTLPSIAAVQYTVLAVGKARPPFTDDVQHYQRLIARHARLSLIEVREDEQVERRIPERAYVSLLDAGGQFYGSEEFARWVDGRRLAARDVCFVVGGPYGTSLDHVDHKISLGPMTLPHQLARVILMEQIYRACTLMRNIAYHK